MYGIITTIVACAVAHVQADSNILAASDPGNASQYAVFWPSLLPEPGKNTAGGATFLNSMPLGNGHVGANILYDSQSSAIVALIAATSAWAEDGELIKVGLLEVKLADAVMGGGRNFSQRLDPQTATWTLADGDETVASAFIDANSDTLVVHTQQPSVPTLVTLRVDKASGVGSSNPPFSCQTYSVSPDVPNKRTTAQNQTIQLVVHHNTNTSGANDYMATTLAGENIPQDAGMRNPLKNRATGAAVTTSSDGRTVVASVLTDDSGSATVDSFGGAVEALLMAAVDRATTGEMKSKHDAWWSEKWASHYIHVHTAGDKDAAGSRLSSMYCLQRYTQIVQARSPYPIKFNGMLFTANRPPLADHRDWGGLNWWQNLRLPYYNQLQAGDHEMIATLFEQFNRTLPIAEARTRRYFGFDGIWWPEYTHPLYGTTHPASYGCGRGSAAASKDTQPVWHSEDPWNGYNRQGSLDLSLMILDHYAYTGATNYLGIPIGVVEFYWNLWQNTSSAPGKPMRFFPTQAVETWQCPGWPVDPTNCPSNDMPTVAGLHAVLQKLLDHPPPQSDATTRTRWADMQGRLPPLPTRQASAGSPAAYIPCADCSLSTTPRGDVNCSAWNCSCQAMTNMYGSDAGVGFGCAPPAAMDWWSNIEHCSTKTATDGCAHPPAAGCGTGVEKTHTGCCPACHMPGPPPPPPPAPAPGCHHTSNSENAELYCLHPYRVASVARGDAVALSLARVAFQDRTNRGDSGWNQVAMDAALIGNASEAAGYVLARAATPPAKGYRFPTFAPHEQDYEPSSDHFGVMQNALAYMLMQLADDKAQSVMLLPAWPCSWDASFRLHAPKQTTITGSVVDGKLSYVVSPSSREADVKAFACQHIA